MTWWETLGWLGNACFFSRFLVQWWVAERQRTSKAPTLFWVLSLLGSVLMAVYAINRGVPVLVVGFSINGSIYLRNLWLRWGRRPESEPSMSVVNAVAVFAVLALIAAGIGQDRFTNTDETTYWTVIAVAGQAIWSSRFVTQWWYSEKHGVSHFPQAFWWISLVGNSLLLAYALHLWDGVFIAGLALGPFIQIRNLWIANRTIPAPHSAAPAGTEPSSRLSTEPAAR